MSIFLSVNHAIMDFPMAAGIIAASMHVLSGPDHLAAVAPLSVEKHNKSWQIGLFWGLGHLSGMLLIGILVSLFRDFIPVERISKHSEQLVGIVLIGIGLWSFWMIKQKTEKTHRHPHIHTEDGFKVHIHDHPHNESGSHAHSHKNGKEKQGVLAAFTVGTIHGLAGVSHFLLFLPTLTFESNFQAGLYLVGFAIGTVISMMLFSIILGRIAIKTKQNHNDRLFTGIRFATGIFAILIGVYWLFSN